MNAVASSLKQTHWLRYVVASAALFAVVLLAQPAGAINQLPTPDPQSGSFGMEATKPKSPPTQTPRITTPGNGASFNRSPITINGICHQDLLVQVYNNNVMVGAVMCRNNSFTLQVSLFAGTNELTAIQYDELGQASPRSGVVTVTYTDTSFTAFGDLVTLTSNFGRRAAPAGSELRWPLQLSGGAGPYALSIDWGDGTQAQLQSQAMAGTFNIAHTYKQAGIYQVNVRVTDSNGVSAFLQLIAVASGQVDEAALAAEEKDSGPRTIVLWIPAAVALILLIPAYWLGRRSQLVSLRQKMLKERDSHDTTASSAK